MNKFVAAFLFSLLSMAFFQLAWSDVNITIIDSTLKTIEISGTITDSDAEQFRNHVTKHGSPWEIMLNSKGGSVNAAISIGRQIRQLKMVQVIPDLNPDIGHMPLVVVDSKATCESSCVYILAGGLRRVVDNDGSVGIHRPFLNDDPSLSIEKQKIQYQNIEKIIKEYLEEVNVPISLYDIMFRIPPGKMRYLSEQEMQDYNLNEDDPYFHEAELAESAKDFKMSKLDYLKFEKERDEKCFKNNPNWRDTADCQKKLIQKYRK